MPTQGIDSFELLFQEKITNHPSVGDNRVAAFDSAKACPAKTMLPEEISDFSFANQIYYSYTDNESNSSSDSDSSGDSESSDDENGNEIRNSPNQVIYSDVFLDSDSLHAQQKLNFLNTESVNVCGFKLSSSDLFSIPECEYVNEELETQQIDKSLLSELDEQGNLLVTQIDLYQPINPTCALIEQSENEVPLPRDNPNRTSIKPRKNLTPSRKKKRQATQHSISNNISSAKQIDVKVAGHDQAHAYKDSKGYNRGICSVCEKDRRISFRWNSPNQTCESCRRRKTRCGVCTTCAKNGDKTLKLILYKYGSENQQCGCCREKETGHGTCSVCSKSKVIVFNNGKPNQQCGHCRAKDAYMGTCSICNGYKVMHFNRGKDNQQCLACRKRQAYKGICSTCNGYKVMNFHRGRDDQQCVMCRKNARKMQNPIKS